MQAKVMASRFVTGKLPANLRNVGSYPQITGKPPVTYRRLTYFDRLMLVLAGAFPVKYLFDEASGELAPEIPVNQHTQPS
ncbi:MULTISPECIES: hypothetical protein [unclassified Paenibacillus]|uniref:hypothetical protein n=1 Tax=unclassified Paenibacillus TaxID=185978 RepID=UPI0036428C56